MSETAETLSLVQKLAKIRAMSDVVKKDKKGFNYSYVQITTILANITAGMKKYGVSLIPSIIPGTSSVTQNVIENVKMSKDGNAVATKTTEMLFFGEMNFKWVNDDNPEEFIDIPWVVTGSMTDPAQAMGAGLTYTTRQFLTSYFQIAQTDQDIDAFRSKQKEAEEVETKAVIAGMIGEIDKIVKNTVQTNPDKREELIEYISRFVKGANYNAIKDITTATNLLSGLKEKYIETEGE